MADSFTASCPQNNNVVMAPLVTTASVKCKACGLGTVTSDLSPEAGKYQVHITWGRNIHATGDASGYFSSFDLWEILMVDQYGISYGQAGTVGVHASEQNCCDTNEYGLVVSGSWATGADRFMIVPHAKAVTSGNKQRGAFSLPMGVMTSKFVDVTTGTVTEVLGKITLVVSDPAAFVASPHAKNIVTDGILAAADAATKISREMIYIISITVATSRRLLGTDSENSRRLAAGGINVDYKVLVPAGHTGTAFSSSSITAATLGTAITTSAKQNGLSAAFEVVGTPDVQTSTTKSVTGTDETPVTGGASPMAGLSAFIVAIIALTGQQLLA
jgi:hypothetical protein